jgi:hypothetical protein
MENPEEEQKKEKKITWNEKEEKKKAMKIKEEQKEEKCNMEE